MHNTPNKSFHLIFLIFYSDREQGQERGQATF